MVQVVIAWSETSQNSSDSNIQIQIHPNNCEASCHGGLATCHKRCLNVPKRAAVPLDGCILCGESLFDILVEANIPIFLG